MLVQMDDKEIQRPIYYTSKVLQNVETRYFKSKKNIFALIISTQHLGLYFQAHSIIILIDQPLEAILYQLETFR